MKKVKYYYDTKSLSYKKIERSWRKRLKHLFVFLSASAFFAALMLIAFFNFFDSPKEKMLLREIDNMSLQYELMNEKLKQITAVLENVQDRDDNIYRVIFEELPLVKNVSWS